MTRDEALRLAQAVFGAVPDPSVVQAVHVIPLEIAGGALIRVVPVAESPPRPAPPPFAFGAEECRGA